MVMPEKAWAYYSSAAEDEITNRENHVAYHRCDKGGAYTSVALFTKYISYQQDMVETTYPQGCHARRLVNEDPWPRF